MFYAGVKLRAPLWRLIIHDWSKFSPAEWGPYADYFYGGHKEKSFSKLCAKTRFDRAWLHHIHRNPHHWNHWLLMNGSLGKAQEMPLHFAVEMLADWFGAGRAITGSWNISKWYRDNYDKIVLHPHTRAWVDHMLGYTQG